MNKYTKYEISFFAVGHGSKGGDAILIRLYDENNNPIFIVIDGGYSEYGSQIVDYLSLCNIDLVINPNVYR